MGNIVLHKQKVSTFRKIALGTWRTTYDPSVYGTMRVRMDRALEYLNEYRDKTGKRLTITHMTAFALARAVEAMPDANCLVRFHKLYRRGDVTMSFQVVMEEGEGGDKKIDLSALTLRGLEAKTLTHICDEFAERVSVVREGKDVAMEKARGNFKALPFWMVHWALKLTSFLTYTLNLDLRKLGIPQDPFGTAMITNIGSLGLHTAYAPLVPYSRCPLILAIGAVEEVPVVDDGQVVPGQIMDINATFDHRVMDGMHAAIMCRTMREIFENPYEHFDPIE